MFSLIKTEDKKVMANSRFVKNAVFYKDLFAFFETYEQLMEKDKKSLPNFCVLPNGKYCLEGICLFMKLYASEFGFETLRLSLDYLKVIYYTIAGYSEDGKTVDKTIIEREFNEYKKASVKVVAEAKKEIEKSQNEYKAKKDKFDKFANKHARNLVVSKFYGAFKIVAFVLAFFVAMLPFTFHFLGKISMTTAIVSAGIALVCGLGMSLLFKLLANKTETASNDAAYTLQMLKKEKDAAFLEFKEKRNRANKIVSEKYEYLHSFSEVLDLFSSKLNFDETMEKASEYRLISYNVVNDIKKLFASQQKDVFDVCHEVAAISFSENANRDLTNLYERITESDWLYFNNEVRFSFLKKFVEVSEKNHVWTINIGESKFSPFGVDIRSIAKEEVAYLNSKDELFVASSIDKFLDTKYAKELKTFELKGNTNAELLKTIKAEYIDHFYNYDSVKNFNNLFYDQKFAEGVKVTDEILNENQKIPTHAYLKIKLLESNIGLGNSESSAIKQIVSEIEGVVVDDEGEDALLVYDESDITYPEFECENVEDIDDSSVKYTHDGKDVVGYKLANI